MAGRGGVPVSAEKIFLGPTTEWRVWQLRSGGSSHMKVVGPKTQELLRLETTVVCHGEGSGVSGMIGGGSGVKWLGSENLGHQNWGKLGESETRTNTPNCIQNESKCKKVENKYYEWCSPTHDGRDKNHKLSRG
ncbi:hypothetical protein Fot_37587 [Forsythia ovata]|uniref:Uncharacterized protein n=1 Tax=Forsythia ovata TaxID=205694 RepID=A0ABD1RZF3_9LAMI